MANSPELSITAFFKQLSTTSKKKLNPISKLVGENRQIIEQKFSNFIKLLPPRFYKIFALVFILAALGYVSYLAIRKRLSSNEDT